MHVNLGGYLKQSHTLFQLGSGLGRCGLLAHHLSPGSRIFLTDGDTDTLSQLRRNTDQNKLDDFAENVSCHQLLWGEATARRFLDNHCGGIHFDKMIGSDLVYVPKVVPPLFECVRTLLSRDGEFIMAHCARREGSSVTVDMVLDGACSAGLDHSLVTEEDDISVFSFRLK